MPEPIDKKLYDKIKREVYKMYKKHSAYRSSMVVKRYKAAGGKYRGKKSNTGLTRWHKEKWINQRGNQCSYKRKGDICRPSRRITRSTPITMNELNKTEIRRAIRKKKSMGRVNKFRYVY